MQLDGTAIMQELREDHRNMAAILDQLDDVTWLASSGKDPDFPLLGEIMRYMTVYPDAVHHPKEDVMYERLRSERPDLSEGLDDVCEDHRAIAELGARLRDDVEAVIAGAAVRREKLIEDASAYVSRLRAHMQWEEGDLFKRIDSMLDAEPMNFDVSRYAHVRDPLFGTQVDDNFERLTTSMRP
ncbi:MAG: hemerythrin domain-containing protein [Gammaproteobacteria bacterium]|nr:hemerythrin domain-containing protein [Gammaproteobacteria bacterium]